MNHTILKLKKCVIRQMCNKVVEVGPWQLKDVPDWFVTHQQIKIWHVDDDYYDQDEITEWYEGYEKRMAQKDKK